MNENDTSYSSETNWAMVDALTDETIDRSELPPRDEFFFAHATWRMPKKPIAVTVYMDSDLLAWFKALGSQYEQRMVAALRIYAEVHRDSAKPTAVAA